MLAPARELRVGTAPVVRQDRIDLLRIRDRREPRRSPRRSLGAEASPLTAPAPRAPAAARDTVRPHLPPRSSVLGARPSLPMTRCPEPRPRSAGASARGPASSRGSDSDRTRSVCSSAVTDRSPRAYEAANTSPRRASITASTPSRSTPFRSSPSYKSAECPAVATASGLTTGTASARRLDTPTSSTPSDCANPRAVAIPTRRPVNLPGPTPTAIRSIASQPSPASPSSSAASVSSRVA